MAQLGYTRIVIRQETRCTSAMGSSQSQDPGCNIIMTGQQPMFVIDKQL